ncbi:MAG: 50S ribosomal protein L25/general stress protein Ctc [Crocinitomicaceae bacterium]|nr:50S ribosomal protein L25/general stress protein Ctc [Crocinitomicaceae bacterium]
MKEVSLSGSVRQSVGKKDAKAVRNAGNVPCIIYGRGEQTGVSIKHTDLEKVIVSPNVYILNIDVEGKAVKAIIQEVQFHPVTDRILHVDFLELQDDKKVKIDIPVRTVGRAIGVMNGGKLQKVFRKLKVYAYPSDLPDAIEVDIANLRIGGMIRVGELATDKLEMLNPANAVVVGVKMARGAVAGAEEEEGEEADAPAEEAAAE